MAKNWSYMLIAMGAALWGLIAIFVQGLHTYGFSSLQIVTIRVTTAGVILLLYVFYKDRSLLKIEPKDCKYFLATGILSIVFFNWCYFTAIQEISLSIAVVLLYTGPLFVTIISRFLFHESITNRKLLALSIMLAGCALVVGVLPAMKISISLYGLLLGLGSGLGYSLYSIFGKLASNKYSSLTITTYTFLSASAALLPFSELWGIKELFSQTGVIAYGLGLGLIPTALAYMLYTMGLAKIESSRAAIMATIEPVVAMVIGFCYFGDRLTLWQIIGGVFVLAAVTLIQEGEVDIAKE